MWSKVATGLAFGASFLSGLLWLAESKSFFDSGVVSLGAAALIQGLGSAAYLMAFLSLVYHIKRTKYHPESLEGKNLRLA
jgi:hypothetical protein